MCDEHRVECIDLFLIYIMAQRASQPQHVLYCREKYGGASDVCMAWRPGDRKGRHYARRVAGVPTASVVGPRFIEGPALAAALAHEHARGDKKASSSEYGILIAGFNSLLVCKEHLPGGLIP